MLSGRSGGSGRGSVGAAALAGALAWTTYAVVENLFVVVLPRLGKRGDEYRELHAGVSALLFVLYPLIGALCGALAAKALARFRRRAPAAGAAPPHSAAAMLALVPAAVAIAVSLFIQDGHPQRIRLSGLAVSAGIALLLPWIALSRRPLAPARALARPLPVSLLLVGTPWICGHASVRPLRAALAGLAFVAVVAALALALARRTKSSPAPPGGALRSAAPPALAALALAVLGGQFHQTTFAAAETDEAGADRPRGPNIVLVTLDTVRADHLSLYGYARDTTPRLGALAERSSLYLRAVSPADMTLSSHASIFSGLYPSRHGAHFEVERCPAYCGLDGKRWTLAELLARNGYRTSAVVANYGFLGHSFGLDQGFARYDSRRAVLPFGEADPFTVRRALRDLLAPHLSPELSEREYRRADEIVDRGIAELDRMRAGGGPFFLFLNFMDAHEPYMPPPPWNDLFPGRDAALRRDDLTALERRVLKLEEEVPPATRAHLVSQYDGGIAFMDHELDRLWRHLDSTGLLDGALVVVTSDHGEAFGERRLFGHEVSVYQEEVHVPLLVKFPRQRSARRIDAPVSLADLLPTILEAAGLPSPPDLDGRSFAEAPAAEGERPIVSESFGNYLLWRWHPRFRRVQRSITSGDAKLIASTSGASEAFDLAADPAESRPLPADGPRWRALEGELDRWLSRLARVPAGEPHELDAATEERLRSLGYL